MQTFAVAWLSITASPACAKNIHQQQVLVVHSYHKDQVEHVMEMDKGIAQVLSEGKYGLHSYYMDTKRHTEESWKRKAGAKAKEMVRQIHPELVLAMDDNAQKYFTQDYAGKPGPPWFVFGGVNKEPEEYGFPAENVTGVLERPNILESIKLLLKIKPDVRRILIMADKSATTDPMIDYCKTLSLPVTVVAYEQPLTLEEWKKNLEHYHGQVDAVGLYVLRTITRSKTDSTKVMEQELIDIINRDYHLPTVGFFDSAAASGVLCAISVSMREQGVAAATIAKHILDGRRPGDIPVRPTDQGRIQLNLRTAEHLGIQIPYSIIKRAEVVIR
nr:ABC transporter substrate binding protein [uncultured Desulfobulbus sp.]